MNYERLRSLTATTAFLAGLSFVTCGTPARAAVACAISATNVGSCVEGSSGMITLNKSDVRGLKLDFDMYMWNLKPDENTTAEPTFCLAKATTGCDIAVAVPGRVIPDSVVAPGYTYIPGKQQDHAVDMTAKRHVAVAISDSGMLTLSVRFTDTGPLVPVVKNLNVAKFSPPTRVSWAATGNGAKVDQATGDTLTGALDALVRLMPGNAAPGTPPKECTTNCAISINDGYMVVTNRTP
ncbi:hypothetical protein ACIBHX_01345 [Nonomuraea sp. NPDC050536]|uniref:hypothetical protein n=1 Tax=Nonomuraea sp. NPDC050536 TaxID=3364366 RepID=UPI0037CCAE36